MDRRQRRASWINPSPVLLAVVIVGLLWVCFTVQRNAIRPACSDLDLHCSADHLIAQDPYCIVDPTCAAPGLSSGKLLDPTTGRYIHWHGFAIGIDSDPTVMTRESPLLFALPNLTLFILTFAVAIWGSLGALTSVLWRRVAVAGFATWYFLEATRWTYSDSRLSQYTGGKGILPYLLYLALSGLLTLLLLAVLMLPLVLTAFAARSRLR